MHRIVPSSSDQVILEQLGARIARHRLNRNLTQDRLAEEAGVSRPTVARLEAGKPTNVANLIRVLRALDLLDALEAWLPEAPASPMGQLKAQSRQRARGATERPSPAPAKGWTWGDEQ